MTKYTFSRINNNNINAFTVLFNSTHKKKYRNDYFKQKYDTSYVGTSHIGYIAFNGLEPIAIFGIIPIIVSIQGRKVIAGQACDALTLSKYRNEGLFYKLTKLTLELAKDEGIHFVFGFPNEHNLNYLTKKFDFSIHDTMNVYNVKFSSLPWKYLNYLKPNNTNNNINEIENSIILEGFDGIDYSRNYFNYKKINGNVIVKENQSIFWINRKMGNWIGAFNSSVILDFSSTIQDLEKTFNHESVLFQVSKGTKADTLLNTKFNSYLGFSIILKNLSNVYNLENLKFQFCDLDTF